MTSPSALSSSSSATLSAVHNRSQATFWRRKPVRAPFIVSCHSRAPRSVKAYVSITTLCSTIPKTIHPVLARQTVPLGAFFFHFCHCLPHPFMLRSSLSLSHRATTTNTHTTAPALTDLPDPDEPALTRFARLKQREQALNSRTNQSGFFTSPPKPEKWSVKDTSVNIATAFHQAAATAYDMQPNNPNNSWASGRPGQTVPRSTSVEYEKEAAARRHAALALPKPNSRRKPLAKAASLRHVPDSEGEDGPETPNGRAKSPFEEAFDMARRALSPATFYLRQRSHEPENEQRAVNGDESSYDYAAEEAEYQSIIHQGPHSRRGTTTAHKRNRMSLDNKAYRPTASDLEDEDEDFDDEGRKVRRRKKKKEPLGGPLTTLPSVAKFDKKKRRKSKGSRGNLAEMDEDERSDSDDDAEEHVPVRPLPFSCFMH